MVFHLVSKFTQDHEVLCAAILHDVIEDTDTQEEELLQVFGQRVTSLVNLLSENKELPYMQRKEEYFDRLIGSGDTNVWLIKSADILYNLCDVKFSLHHSDRDSVDTMFNNGFDTYLSFSDMKIRRLEEAWSENPFIPELKETLEELKSLLVV